jgi:uncharacterized membrane protein YfcA
MNPSIPFSELVALALALAATGLVAGLLAGIFGIGGGGIIVPVMYQTLTLLGFSPAITMHVSLGSALAIIVPTSISSFRAHRARKSVDMAMFRSWLVPLPLGVGLASLLVASVGGAALRAIFAGMALLVGLRLIFNRESWRIGDEIPRGPIRVLVGMGIGFLSTLMGVGGGVLTNTFMTMFGRPIHQAVGTAAGVGALIAIPGTVGYIIAGWGAEDLPPFSLGYVNLLSVAILTPLSLFMAPIGARIAHAMSKRQLEVGFGVFLLLMSARFTYSLL